MKKLKFIGLISSVLLSSCSYHMGTIGGGTGTVTNNQFASIDFAYGTAETINFLGIGGNQKDALVLEAKRNLYLNYKLKPKQVIGQTTVDFKRTLFFPILVTKVTISSEIIDFSDIEIDSLKSQENKNQFTNPNLSAYKRLVNPSELEKYYTPKSPEGELVKFRYENEAYTGEMIKKTGTVFLIKMEKGNGESIGLYISENDIIK